MRLALAKRRGEDVRPADVAREMGVSRAAYLHWEKGLRKPKDIGTYMRLAAFMEVPLAELGVPIADMAPERDLELVPPPPQKKKPVRKRREG